MLDLQSAVLFTEVEQILRGLDDEYEKKPHGLHRCSPRHRPLLPSMKRLSNEFCCRLRLTSAASADARARLFLSSELSSRSVCIVSSSPWYRCTNTGMKLRSRVNRRNQPTAAKAWFLLKASSVPLSFFRHSLEPSATSRSFFRKK